MNMPSIFTRIINRELPAHIIAEDNQHLAFLDINPLKEGHTLVIPKIEIDYIFNLDDKTIQSLNLFAIRVGRAIEKSIPCKRIGIVVLGLEVPHAHIHLIPLDSESDINFSNPKLKYTNEKFEKLAYKIKSNISDD